MIIDKIISAFFNFLIGILDLIPVPTVAEMKLNSAFESIQFLIDLIAKTNTFFPVEDLFIILPLIFLIKNFKIILFCINWIIRRIGDIIP